MNIKLAEVRNNSDITETGLLAVQESDMDFPILVKYTSPYTAGQDGGFIAIPEVGSRILICKPENDPSWYYLTSIHGPNPAAALADQDKIRKDINPLADKNLYKARGVPMRLSLQTPIGHGLLLSDEYNPNYFNSKVELHSATGKKVELIDSPLIDSIIIRNEFGDRIKISTSMNGANAARSIEIECKGPVNIISRESEINLHVLDGKEINIINESTGAKRTGENDPTPGNINVKSSHGDINIDVMDRSGMVLINAEGEDGIINIKSKGIVSIDGDKGVAINSSNGDVVVTGQTIQLN